MCHTQQQLMQSKSMDAYNYYKSGHVRNIRVWIATCVMMAKVNPSQAAPQKAHHAWVGVKNDGQVISAHCICMAGSGEPSTCNRFYNS